MQQSEKTSLDKQLRHWFALYTRPRYEDRVRLQLEEKKIETYLPTRKVLRHWSDRKKWMTLPLFSSYVFVKANAMERYRAVQAVGAMRIIHFHGDPVKVQEEEIDRIKRLLREIPEIETADYFTPGMAVEMTRGPLAGMRGILTETSGAARLTVRIDSVQQALRFSVSRGDVRAL